ncbi:MAG TPA: peptidylprolyl isomerase [Burkholderiales bacterium]|nr:peptidylprolyl isomerase [Burkholderiales bacterium]
MLILAVSLYRQMKRIGLFAILMVAAMGAVAQVDDDSGASDLLLDRVVALVNDAVITQLELDAEVRFAVVQLRRQGTPLPQQSTLERQVLERMIITRILELEASQTGIRVSDSQLNQALERMAAENSMTRDQFQEAMQADGLDFIRFREKIRGEIQIARLKEREVDNRINISQAEIDSYLRNEEAKGVEEKSDEYLVAHILLLVPEGANAEEIRLKRDVAADAISRLEGGADFRQVAAGVSDAADALEGGMLGWRTAARLPELFLDAVSSMRIGEVSDVLRSANGFHIVKLVDKRGNDTPIIVQQTHAQHILIRLNEIVSEGDALQRLSGLKQRLELGGEDFAELARQHSDDASAAKGGDLGWLSPGETVPEFERAMDALQPGQVSGPVRSPFGFHLIKVLERRDEDLSEERQRVMARQAIRLRKSDAAYQDWVRQQRDKAYVEYRLEES